MKFDKAEINDSEIDINELIQEDRFSFQRERKKKVGGFIYQNSKDVPERTMQALKEEEEGWKEGRKEWGRKRELNSINICLHWLSGEVSETG